LTILLRKIIGLGFGLILLVGISGAVVGYVLVREYGQDLPDYTQLARYDPALVTRVLAGDGRLLAEYAVEKRVFVPIEAIPKRVSNAFLSAEDKTFYEHSGIDIPGIVSAIFTNVVNLARDRRPVGASTITQQVAKNFLLTNELSIARKVKEIILAYRIEKAYSKPRILELYLNEIYLGEGSYGVAAAALNYFNKSLDELTVAEAALLAAMPKAPANYSPIRKPDAAMARRAWVIGRMVEDGHIGEAEAELARVEPITLGQRGETESVRADYFAEEVRRELIARFGEDGLYKSGLIARASIDPALQVIADKSLRDGLVVYDRRHGWRGALARIDIKGDWEAALGALPPPAGLSPWRQAVVLEIASDGAGIGFADAAKGVVPVAEMIWARQWLEGQLLGKEVKKPGDVLKPGDVIAVEAIGKNADGKDYPPGTFALRQIPDLGGALVALDPHTGRVLAMSGGWSYEGSEFNRATQALRQPGSSFKPFVYLTAFDNGFTPSTLVLDAPIVVDQGPGQPLWKPENYTQQFYGPSTLRLGIEKSRNLMTVRLAQAVGMAKIVETAKRFGIVDDMLPTLAMALGSAETTVLKLTTAYAMLVNGGKRIVPSFIDRIQDRRGRTIYRQDERACEGCNVEEWQDQPVPEVPDMREQIADPLSAYQVVHLLEGAVERGTGGAVKAVGKPLAGKTGTTNDFNDAWFVGFSPDLAVGVYLGFDSPRSLGDKEAGGSVAAPIFRDVMMAALEGKPATPFRTPPGIRLIRVNSATGLRASAGDPQAILEAFKPGSDPNNRGPVVGEAMIIEMAPVPGTTDPGSASGPASGGSGDLY
jgi:penicillin-binding protein 1A